MIVWICEYLNMCTFEYVHILICAYLNIYIFRACHIFGTWVCKNVMTMCRNTKSNVKKPCSMYHSHFYKYWIRSFPWRLWELLASGLWQTSTALPWNSVLSRRDAMPVSKDESWDLYAQNSNQKSKKITFETYVLKIFGKMCSVRKCACTWVTCSKFVVRPSVNKNCGDSRPKDPYLRRSLLQKRLENDRSSHFQMSFLTDNKISYGEATISRHLKFVGLFCII